MRKLVLTALFFCLLATGAYAAEAKIGYVDIAQVLNSAPQMDKIRENLQSEFKDEEQAIAKKQEELKALQEKAAAEGKNMSEDQQVKMQEQFLQLRNEYGQMLQEYRQMTSRRQQEEFAKFNTIVRREIQAFAQQEGYDLILTEGVAYANSSLNVTDKVLARIKAAAGKDGK